GEDQVTLKVTIAEVRREVLKQLGFDNLVSSSSGMTVAQLGSPSTDSATSTVGGGLARYRRQRRLGERLDELGLFQRVEVGRD
ncbi:hypothetical protein AB9F38_35195, partial [Rhizobium leguminosarum]